MILHDDSSHDKDIYDDSAEKDRVNGGLCSSGDSWQKEKKILQAKKKEIPSRENLLASFVGISPCSMLQKHLC